MSFVEMCPAAAGRKHTPPIRVRVGAKRLVILFHREFCRSAGWQPGQRFKIERGIDDDDGKLRLTRGPKGYTLTQRSVGHASMELSLPLWRGLPRKPVPALAAKIGDHGRRSDAWVITLPSWSAP